MWLIFFIFVLSRNTEILIDSNFSLEIYVLYIFTNN